MTTVYLLRHAATSANLARPYRLQGRGLDMPLDPLGVRQAELTRDYLALHPIERVLSSPLRRAFQTAAIIAEPHGVPIEECSELVECDVGRWEGMTWEAIQSSDPEAYRLFEENPEVHPYPEGESFGEVFQRAKRFFDALFREQRSGTILVVSHHIVTRVYLAGLLGLRPSEAKRVKIDNCGLSVIERTDGSVRLVTLNAAFHLIGLGRAA
ncbi:MAG: histidine phosphatase family protein [Gemmatales bacterium]|nr:histidine phosphatase family protein [Gemmatales bacterium]MDW8385527.1 histidine phosphatase family protein [Gemmatales bacterium]